MKRLSLSLLTCLIAGPALAQPAADPAAICASNDVARAVAACTQALSLPNVPAARRARFAYNRGLNLFRQGRINEAIQDFGAAIALDGKQGQFYSDRGLVYVSLRQYPSAIADYTKAIELQPGSSAFHYRRGLAYTGLGDHARAVADYQTSISLDPTFALGHVSLARSLLTVGRTDDALGRFRQAIAQFPQNAFVYVERGKTFLDLKRYDEAIADFTSALRLEPRSVFALHGRGVAYMEKSDEEKALVDLGAALAINPRYALAYTDRANVHYNMENYEAAIADYTQSIANFGQNPLPYNNRGNAKHRLGRHAEALLDYSQAIALDPRNAEFYHNRGETYVWLSDYDRAIQDFRQATALAPGMERARRGLARAQEIREKRVAVAEPPPAAAPPPLSPAAPAPQIAPASPAAPTPQIPLAAGGGKRVALVIGNAAYKNTPPLVNPVNDASDVSTALRRLGFEVIEEKDLTKAGMDDAFRRFARLSRDSDIALFFYAGHAMQFQGINYLMPIDAKLKDETDLPYEMAKFNDVLDDMSRVKNARIAIIDGCRDNPLEKQLKRSIARTRSAGGGGLAPVSRAEGSIIVYATQSGSVAADGTGRNSPFTAALLNHIESPAVEIGIMFRRVAGLVRESTKGDQFPEISLSLVGEIYLRQN